MFFNSKAIDENEVPEFFNNFFASNFNDKVYDVDTTVFGDNIKLEHVLSSFSVESIIKDIVKIKESCALTQYGFPTKLLKSSPYLFGSLLYSLFRSVILCRTFPAIWKVARITPLFKGGSRNDIKFYRPISLLPKVSLLFERIIFNYLYSCLSKELHPQQFGFQSHKGAVLQLLDYLEKVFSCKSQHKFAIYFDYEKAFDKVPHTILVEKLRRFKLDGNFCTLLGSYLCNRYQFTQVNKSKSKLLPCVSGVPQGSVLGPFSFLVFVNDLPSIFLDSMVWLFADDLKCFSPTWISMMI